MLRIPSIFHGAHTLTLTGEHAHTCIHTHTHTHTHAPAYRHTNVKASGLLSPYLRESNLCHKI